MRFQVRRWSAVVIGLLCTLMVDPGTRADPVTSWSWHAPADVTGPGVFRATIDFGVANECELDLRATGTWTDGHGGLIWVEGVQGTGYIDGQLVHVHHDELGVDTRTGEGEDYHLSVVAFPTMEGVTNLTILVTDLGGWLAHGEDPVYPAEMLVVCEAPFQVVGLSGSREVAALSDETLRGGYGANAAVFGFGGATNQGDHARMRFTSSAVQVDVMDWADGVNVYNWSLATPNHVHEKSGLTNDGHWPRFVDGPGDYRFDLTRTTATDFSYFWVWAAGFDPVATLSEVLG